MCYGMNERSSLNKTSFNGKVHNHKMAADGVFSTPSDAILLAIYTDLHRSATRGALLESGQFIGFDVQKSRIKRILPIAIFVVKL